MFPEIEEDKEIAKIRKELTKMAFQENEWEELNFSASCRFMEAQSAYNKGYITKGELQEAYEREGYDLVKW